jgi:hypothetical protein
VERILNLGMERIGQFVGEPPMRRLIDEGHDGGDQGAEPREPDRLTGPQAGVVEAGGFSESVVAPAMSIAGQVVEEFEFTKDGEAGVGAEGLSVDKTPSDPSKANSAAMKSGKSKPTPS